MPNIQVYTPQVQVQIPGEQRASPQDFGAGIADALRGQARQESEAGDYLVKQEEQKQALDMHKALSDFQLQSLQRQQELNLSGPPAGKTLIDAYTEDFDKRASLLNIPPAMKDKAREELDNMRVQYVGDGIHEQARQAGEQAKNDWQTIVTNNANIVEMNPAMQDKALATLKNAASSLHIDPAARKGLYDDGAQAVRQSAADTISRMNPSGFIAQAKAGQWNDLRELPRYLERVQAGERDDIRDQAQKIDEAAKLGLTIPKQNIDALASRAAATGMEREAKTIREYGDVQDAAGAFAVKSFAAQRTDLLALKATVEKGDVNSVNKYSALAKVYENKVEMMKTDPWQYYAAHGLVKAPQAINISDPKAVAQAFIDRKPDIARVKELEGPLVPPLPLLTKPEVEQIKQVTENGNAQQSASMLASLGANLDHDEKRSLSQAIATQANAPLVAAALNQPLDIGTRILAGEKAKGDVPAGKVRDAVNLAIGGTVLDPEANEAIHESVYSYYKELSLQAGDTAKEVNTDRLNKSIEDVVGKNVSISPKFFGPTSKVFTYRDDKGQFVDENKLEDILGGITDDKLKKVNGDLPYASDGEQVKASDILKKARFVSLGDGLYGAVYDGLGVVSGKNGKPYVFDARKLEKADK